MVKILFLLLFLNSVAFAQTKESKEAYKYFDYQKISNKLLAEKIQAFCAEINKTNWVGFIINSGSPEEIVKKEKRIQKNLDGYDCRKEFPSPRIIFVRNEKEKTTKTVFWVVPPGQKPPLTALSFPNSLKTIGQVNS